MEIRVRDAQTGTAIERCDLVGSRTATSISSQTPSAPNVSADGVHRYRVPPMRGRLKLRASGYSETWTEEVQVEAGTTTSLSLALVPLGRLVVTVVEPDGRPLRDGTLIVVGRAFEQAIGVKDGKADVWLDAGEYVMGADPDSMPGWESFEESVAIRPGERTDAQLRVTRR